MTTTTTEVQLARIFDLAGEFIAATAGRPEPWETALRAWASDRGLTVLELRELRRAVLRRRLFGTRRGRP